ncbi:hypothetical protein [Candidatus Bandiella euplotis]|uniref:Uncharacterized protein n=1 Tax=Candidatus Bandiella euplotis TaxID=1664265 RepID=A0ABZ0UNM0_9RICK|nr:hypothetical protein [Candidatus Bandiella woodruffii]WPX97497.1 hypothetical protein Bandiella_01659 [Candidatus Bandiella woodruffii]
MTTLAITIEEIKKCLELHEKTENCEELLYDERAMELLETTVEIHAKESRKHIVLKNSKREQEKVNMLNLGYNKLREIEDEGERVKLQIAEANKEENLAYNAFKAAGGSMWKKEENINTLRGEYNKKSTGHVGSNYRDTSEAPSKCCWGSSPEIHLECERDLREKINKYDEYENAKKKAADTTKYYKLLESSAMLYKLDEYKEEDQKGIKDINLAEQPSEIKQDVEDAAPLNEEL